MAMDETTQAPEERPVHVVVDCRGSLKESDWAITETPLTDAEWAEHKQRSAEHAAGLEAAAAERAQLAALAAAHPDPLVQALARLAGVL